MSKWNLCKDEHLSVDPKRSGTYEVKHKCYPLQGHAEAHYDVGDCHWSIPNVWAWRRKPKAKEAAHV